MTPERFCVHVCVSCQGGKLKEYNQFYEIVKDSYKKNYKDVTLKLTRSDSKTEIFV